jgi:small subunit ribosomal protein S3
MTHVVHPYAHRLGIIRDWKSRWFSQKNQYKVFLKSDILLRGYLHKRLKGMHVASVELERSQRELRVIVETSRPGIIIGRNGEGSGKLQADIVKFLKKHKLDVTPEVRLDIREVRYPEANAELVAQMVAEGLERRLPFRRVLKQMLEKVMANREVEGIKILIAGRLNGAEMARTEKMKRGRVPLQTFRADIDYTHYEAILPYGVIGIKVWIYKGEIFDTKK